MHAHKQSDILKENNSENSQSKLMEFHFKPFWLALPNVLLLGLCLYVCVCARVHCSEVEHRVSIRLPS